jgi:hypothetical protein
MSPEVKLKVKVEFHVTNCSDCLMEYMGGLGKEICRHPDVDEDTNIDIDLYVREETIPTWCPFIQEQLARVTFEERSI